MRLEHVSRLIVLAGCLACTDRKPEGTSRTTHWTPPRDGGLDLSRSSHGTTSMSGAAKPTSDGHSGIDLFPSATSDAGQANVSAPSGSGGPNSSSLSSDASARPGAADSDAGEPRGNSTEMCESIEAEILTANEEVANQQQWLASLDPTASGNPRGPDIGCHECISLMPCTPPAEDRCSDLNACVSRHCLCQDCSSPGMGSSTFCDCVALCVPVNDSECFQPWVDYTMCVARECSVRCD